MSRIFNPVLLFVATTVAVLLSLLAASFAFGTSTDPLPIQGSDLPKRYLLRDQQTGVLSFGFTDDIPNKFPVASYRFGGFDFQSVTGWFYLQITSRIPTMEASEKAIKKQHHARLHTSNRNSNKNKLKAAMLPKIKLPNEERLRSHRHLSSQPDRFHSVGGADNFFYAGYIEGTLGAQDGRMNFPQYSSGKTTFPPCQTQYLADHFLFLDQQMTLAENGQISDPTAAKFWNQLVRIWNQLDGLAAGYNAYAGSNFSASDAYLANMATDAMDAYCAQQAGGKYEPSINHATTVHKTSLYNYKKAHGVPADKRGKPVSGTQLGGGPLHCSALVKVTDESIYLAHDTWSSWDQQFGYRTWKAYSLADTRTVTMSARLDGSVSSVDDKYANYREGVDGPIAVFETTEEVFNMTLYKQSYPQLCNEFTRVMIANYLADSPKEWSDYFKYLNDGSYCNSYVSVDMSMFTPGQTLPDGIAYLAEQIPGYVGVMDLTPILRAQSYWPGFNIPYQQDIYVASGNFEMYQTQGNFFSWTLYARPLIFHRNQSDITDLESMMRMMRYNDWENDPFSDIAPQWKNGCAGATNNTCSPKRSSMFTIASRGDLMPVYPTQAEMEAHYGSTNPTMVAQGCFGATDSKITSWKYARNSRTSFITNGPTNDQQPVFKWGGACNGNVPPRTPAVLDYPWLMVTIADDE